MADVTTESSKRIPAHAEQCFLVENLDRFTLKKGTTLTQDYSHIGLVNPIESDSVIFLNKIRGLGAPGQRLFENLPKSIAGDIQPYIKLYKVIPFKAGQSNSFKDMTVNLPFNNLSFDPTQITAAASNKKLGVAFRSFSFDFEGKRPVEVDAYVRCSLRLYFESPEALLHRYGTAPRAVAFSDLIARPFIATNAMSHDHLEYDDKYFRIKMVIGYVPPSVQRLTEAYRLSRVSDPKGKAEALITALRNSKFELFLTLLKHTVTPRFDSPDGGYELSIEYIGSLETTFRSKSADILAHPTDAKMVAQLRAWELMLARKRQEAFAGIGVETRAKIEAIAGRGDFNEEVDKEYQTQKDETLDTVREGGGKLTTTFLDWLGIVDTKSGAEAMGEMAKLASTGNEDIKAKVLTERLGVTLLPNNHKNATDYLQWRGLFATYKSKVGPVVKLNDIYSRIITRLNNKSRLYVSTLKNADFENWFLYFDKAKKDDASTNERKLKEINDKIEKATNATDKKLLIQERQEIELLMKDGSSQDRMYSDISRRATENITTSVSTGEAASRSIDAVKAETAKKKKEAEAKKKVEDSDEEPSDTDSEAKKATPTPIVNRDIYYFYYGDLLDTVLEVMSEMKEFLDLNFWSKTNPDGNVKILLGEIELPHPKTGERIKENLARIPITLDTWQRFWLDKVVSPLKKEYLLRSFLHDTLSELIVAALTNKCKRPGSPQLVVRTGIHYESLRSNMKLDFAQKKGPANDKAYYHSLTTEPIIEDSKKSQDNEKEAVGTELIYLHAPSSSSRWFDPKKKEQDFGRGVHHIVLGAENSPIIAASFNKSNQPYYLEAKAEQGAALDDTIHFSEPYNCSITMYGNSIILPGKHIHISFPHSHFGKPYNKNSAARRLGLGGYFFILKTKNEMKASESRLEWTTQLECLWESFGNENKMPAPIYTQKIEPEKSPAEQVWDAGPGDPRNASPINQHASGGEEVTLTTVGEGLDERNKGDLQLPAGGIGDIKPTPGAGRDILSPQGEVSKLATARENLIGMGWSESETAYFMAKLTKGEKIDLTQAPTEPQMMQEPESAAALQAEMDDT
tara:strand:+ start:36031 stop:39276 length:3246 start_codon:yes stop_codon:yes gene_type:complete